jgi:CBS domain-containing protein
MHQLSAHITSDITVRDIMTAPPEMLSENTSIYSVRNTMKTLRVHHAFVQDKHGRLSGVISDRDLTQRRGFRARHIMTRSPISVGPECTPMRAVGLMISKRISCLPVVDGCKLCGLVTTTDLLLTLEAVLKVLSELRNEDRLETVTAGNSECGEHQTVDI